MDDVIDGTGNMPGSVVAQGFTTLSPLTTVTKYANLIEGMWSDDFLQAHQLMTGWGEDHIPIAGATMREVADKLIRSDTLTTEGTVELGGRQVRLSDITIPYRSFVADGDYVVPPAASAAAPTLVGSADSAEVRIPGRAHRPHGGPAGAQTVGAQADRVHQGVLGGGRRRAASGGGRTRAGRRGTLTRALGRIRSMTARAGPISPSHRRFGRPEPRSPGRRSSAVGLPVDGCCGGPHDRFRPTSPLPAGGARRVVLEQRVVELGADDDRHRDEVVEEQEGDRGGQRPVGEAVL